ncbi:hypothetical protein JCM1840_006911 [Sporobolomyces johnsonii]
MLDRLPNELLLRVLELSVSSSFASQPYADRRSTLRNYSLVSHRFRQLAQPLLFALFKATSSSKLRHFLYAVKAIGLQHHVKAVALDHNVGVEIYGGLPPNDLVRLAEDCPALEQLSLGTAGRFDLTRLVVFKHLRSLTLNWGDLSASSPFVLPLLADLTVEGISASPETLASTFTPSTLPSLRALALSNIEHDTSFSEPIEALRSQLHMLATGPDDLCLLPDNVLVDHRPITLLLCSLPQFVQRWDDIISTAHHVYLYCNYYHTPSSNARDLDAVTNQLLHAPHSSLRTVYLSRDIRPSNPEWLLDVTFPQAYDRFLAACVTRGIEICWEDPVHPGDGELDSANLPGFWTKAKALKASASG